MILFALRMMQIPDYRVQIPSPQTQPASFSPSVEQVPSLIPEKIQSIQITV